MSSYVVIPPAVGGGSIPASQVTGLAPSATLDTTNATNISTGALSLPLLASGGATVGQVLAFNGTSFAPLTVSTLPYLPLEFFGDGFLGSLTISTGTTVLTMDSYYTNLTINGTGSLNTNGFRLFVSGVLDLTAAPAGAIVSGLVGVTVGSGTIGAAGGAGSNTTPASTGGAAASILQGSRGGIGGAGGAGGSASGTAGLGGGVGPIASVFINRATVELTRSLTYIAGGQGGSGGGGGGGSNTILGGTGGAGGSGGGVLFIAARTLARSAATAAGAIRSLGQPGLVGGAGGTSAAAGGGGGAGAGGWVYCLVGSLSGTAATGMIDVSGGLGGAGGSTTAGGVGGNGGTAGTVQSLILSTGVSNMNIGNPGSAGGAPTSSGASTGPQVDNFTLNSLTVGTYSIRINGSTISFNIASTDTQQSVLTTLGSYIQGNVSASTSVTGTGASAVLVVTATGGATLVYTNVDPILNHTVPAGRTSTLS